MASASGREDNGSDDEEFITVWGMLDDQYTSNLVPISVLTQEKWLQPCLKLTRVDDKIDKKDDDVEVDEEEEEEDENDNEKEDNDDGDGEEYDDDVRDKQTTSGDVEMTYSEAEEDDYFADDNDLQSEKQQTSSDDDIEDDMDDDMDTDYFPSETEKKVNTKTGKRNKTEKAVRKDLLQKVDDILDSTKEGSTERKHYRPRKTSERTAKAGKMFRPRQKCPFCSTSAITLTRHLRVVHEFDRERALTTEQLPPSSESENDDEDRSPEKVLTPNISKEPTPGTSSHTEGDHEQLPPFSESDSEDEDSGYLRQEGSEDSFITEDVEGKEANAMEGWRDSELIRHFNGWLRGPERLKNEKAAEQHCYQIYQVIKYLDPKLRVSSFLHWKDLRNWFMEAINRYKPGTVCSYLTSIREFINFITTELEQEPEDERKIFEVSQAIKRWNSILGKSKKKRRVEVSATGEHNSISPIDISTCLQSDVAKRARHLLETFSQGDQLSRSDYCLVRNYLIFVLIARNAQRSGAVANLRIKMLKTADKRGSDYILTVPEHKTGYSAPVYLVTSTSTFRSLHVYLSMRQSLPDFEEDIADPDEGYVFISWPSRTGVPPIPMSASRVNRSINDFWNDAGLSSNLSATKLRKSTVTNVRDADPNLREKLSAHMSHSARTADTYYLTHSRYEDSVNVSQKIATVMRVEPQNTVPVPLDDLDIGAEEVVSQEVEDVPDVPGKSKEVDKEVEGLHMQNDNTPKGGRRAFSRSQQDTIIETFHEFISNPDKKLNQMIVQQVLSKTTEGKRLLNIFTLKQLVDRVRTARRAVAKK